MSTIPLCLASVNYHLKYYTTYFITLFRELKLNPKKFMWRETYEIIQKHNQRLPGLLLPHIPAHPNHQRSLGLITILIPGPYPQISLDLPNLDSIPYSLHSHVLLSSQCLCPLALNWVEYNLRQYPSLLCHGSFFSASLHTSRESRLCDLLTPNVTTKSHLSTTPVCNPVL